MSSLSRLERLVEALKSTPRTGWMLRGVPAAIAESIAEHMNEASLIALVLGDELRKKGVNIDIYYAAAIATAHDVSEAIIGDLVKLVTDLIGKEVKESIELHALRSYVGDTILANLVRDYIEQEKMEARLAKLSEQLATLLQGLRYYRQGYDVSEIICSMSESIEKMTQSEPFSLIREELEPITNKSRKICKKNELNK